MIFDLIVNETNPIKDIYKRPRTDYHQYITGLYPQVRDTFKNGLRRGNNPSVFAKLGGSTTETPEFLYYFGTNSYDLGEYTHLQGVINYYLSSSVPINRPNPSNHPGNCFTRRSYGGRNGLVIAQVAEPIPADGYPYYAACDGISTMQCEYDRINPNLVLMWFGINEPFENMPANQFKSEYASIIDYSLNRDILPVLGTIGRNCYNQFGNDGHCHDDYMEDYNIAIRELSSIYHLPLIDFHTALSVLPNDGLQPDNLHLSSPSYQANSLYLTAHLTQSYLQQYGHNVRNLLTLIMLDEIHAIIN